MTSRQFKYISHMLTLYIISVSMTHKESEILHYMGSWNKEIKYGKYPKTEHCIAYLV